MADSAEERLRKLEGLFVNGTPGVAVPSTQVSPEARMMQKLQSLYVTDDVMHGKKPPGSVEETPGWNMGMAVGNGMLQGILPNIIAEHNVAGSTSWLHPWRTSPAELYAAGAPYQKELEKQKAARESYGVENPGKALAGELGGSLSTAIPAMAMGAGALAPLGAGIARAAPWTSGIVDFLSGASKVRELKAASQALRGGVEGAEAAGITSGLSDEPLKEQMAKGGGIGMVLGPAGAVVGKSHVNKTTADSAQALLNQGIAVRAGDIPGSSAVAQGLNKIFGSGGAAGQREQFGEKLTGYAGLPEKEVSQGWVTKNDARIGQTMNDIQKNYGLPKGGDIDTHLDLANLRMAAQDNLSTSNAKKVNDAIDQIEGNLAKGVNGHVYKNLTQQNGLLHNLGKDADISQFINSHSGLPGNAKSLRETLDDAWGRALPTDKKEAWDAARKEYRVTRAIDDSMGATGAAQGIYNPKALLKAVEKRYGNVDNAGDLGMLARGGQFLEAPGSAPASKHGMMKTATGSMAVGAALADAASGGQVHHSLLSMVSPFMHHPETYALPLAGVVAGLGAGAIANRVVNSPRATQYLLDVSRGSRNPMLNGVNPLLPFAVNWTNYGNGATNSPE